MRAELFSVERLEEHARSLSQLQKIRITRGRAMAPRLAENEQILRRVFRTTIRAVGVGTAITPAAEWLIDNYHLVERQIQEVRADLPPGFYRQLPKLLAGPFAGYPRVFELAWAYVAHTDSRFDVEMLRRFVRAYQDVQVLTIGELWAVAITLRIVLIENLRRIAVRIEESQAAREAADALADRIMARSQNDETRQPAFSPKARAASMSDAFAVELLHRLRDQGTGAALALTWLDEGLAKRGTNAGAAVEQEQERQVSATVSVKNIITSLRLISEVDWLILFERMSPVDDVLSAGTQFQAMDIPTRNAYRTAVEELARSSDRSEMEIAIAAVQAATQSGQAADPRCSDPGYYLLAGGREAFEAKIRYRIPVRLWPQRASRALGIGGYGAVIVVVAALILLSPLAVLSAMGLGLGWLALLAILGAIPALDAAVAVVNAGVTRSISAMFLPALELRDGVPPEMRTIVAVPMMLTSPEAIEEQIEALEIHHLSSLEGHVHFALLSDWADASEEEIEDDQELLDQALEGIARLNAKYGPAPGGDRFLLFHRRRTWCASERRWIGWERKRGKLHELNRLLRGAADTTFITLAGKSPSVPHGVRYVLTLDADTRLPRDAVRRLIGKIGHPINRPRFDQAAGRVVEGYGVLQPRITASLPSSKEGSLFQRIFSSPSGIDPYAAAVSDVYQDLFGEGSYAGKGIYDVDAFEASLAGRVPDSTLLSHDLFEGIFARAGLVSDVEVVEEFPSRYEVSAVRNHRWARGDWQLLPWILGPGGKGRNSVPITGRWKMLDNLRRSLTAPASMMALLAGWGTSLGTASVWTAFVVTVMAAPAFIPLFESLLRKPGGGTLRSQLSALGIDLRLAIARFALMIVFMADQAWLMGDAIVRTLVRLLITRRHLLQWVPAAQVAAELQLGILGFLRRMWGALVLAGLAIALTLSWSPETWPLAIAFAALWIASPAVAWRVSAAAQSPRRLMLYPDEVENLRSIARRTWRYFETFVTAEDQMLPPDNFQESPTPTLAHRTSPTNIGLYLLSVASARDFGWIGTLEAVERLETTFATMDKLARVRGHFLNWYDTTDLRPLDPQYISSVDSGNLAGHLVALASACREWRSSALSPVARLRGVQDALKLAHESAESMQGALRAPPVAWRQLESAIAQLSARIAAMSEEANLDSVQMDELAGAAKTIVHRAHGLSIDVADPDAADFTFWVEATASSIESHQRDLELAAGEHESLALRLLALEETARATAVAMDFKFLIDEDRKLLSIGYLVSEGALDLNCYDLLASEARLASFFAIAKGDVAARHWFRLGHATTMVGGGPALISWSGSMFEYLMPALVMRPPVGSLLELTDRRVVDRQIAYGNQLGIPWGISESAYNARDLELTYQYSNFGVPGLGLKRGLGDNSVIAPYATALAAMAQPRAAIENFRHLETAGGKGRYGFYEALDYTPARVPQGKRVAIVQAFMAHHQGMTIVALANTVLDSTMPARFHDEPLVKAAELLLQERMPRHIAIPLTTVAEEGKGATQIKRVESGDGRRLTSPHSRIPATCLLSNGRYTVMLTAAGAGYSRWHNLALTRWREDATCEDWGASIYLKDVDRGDVWSAGFQPTGTEPDHFRVTFNEDRAEFLRRDGDLTTGMTVLVSTEDDAEVRRISISNGGSSTRQIEITSYVELALATQAADAAHPAFSKLFVETEFLRGSGALLAHRRRRDPAEDEVWAGHLVVVERGLAGKPEFETDRARFLGRGRSLRAPRALIEDRMLSGTTGTVLDPIFSLRARVQLAPGETAQIAFWTLVGSTRQTLIDLIDKHHDVNAFERAATLGWTQAQVQLRHLGLSPREAGRLQRLAGHIIYASPQSRSSSDVIEQGAGAQSGLWSLGISGDLPIVLLRIGDIEQLSAVRDLLKAMQFWRMKRLEFDVVILNERGTSYFQELQDAVEGLVRASPLLAPGGEGLVGKAFVLRSDLMPEVTRLLLLSVARVVLVGNDGPLANHLDAMKDEVPPKRLFAPRVKSRASPPISLLPPALEYFNGLGGFADDGREYVITLGSGETTPAPWINIVSNPRFGFQVSAEGAGYTWAMNSREHQLTPWSNDPIEDSSGQVFYVRDEETGELWSPTASPLRDEEGAYVARHGWGYSRFEYDAAQISLELLEYVPVSDPLKISRLTIRNNSPHSRRLSVVGYVEWVLGSSRPAVAPFTVTAIDAETGAMFARNKWNPVFEDRIAFIDLGGRQTSWTADRSEFIGRNGSLGNPAVLAGVVPLSNSVGAGFDACGALQAQVEVGANSSIELAFFLGEAASAEEARSLIHQYRSADLGTVLEEVGSHWEGLLGAVKVKTPDRSLDIMLNGWLLYQTLACRIWARSAFYQASGAYGFRDQLQDVMALTAARPAIAREHLIRAAGRQFAEGDVQHWWLPQLGNGVRTRFADDLLWLPFVAAHYLSTTGDADILDVDIPFLTGPILDVGEAERFFQPETSEISASLYEHCARALDASLKLGNHCLPLFGGGDWNDGFNRVGEEGRGESVWLGWFLHAALSAFVPIARGRRDEASAVKWEKHAGVLRAALDREAWDGDWYLRGWFDDGTPLGSSASAECRIDSIAQSWAVISGAGNPERAARAMAAVERELVSPEKGLALLFAPPFDRTPLDPGYIKGYPPGIRENGGQYTHAALWSVFALAALKEGDKAAALLSLLNPINHSRTRAEAQRYKVEPYVVAADIYSTPPHVGRGGWTWYTGAAGWMQRAGVESILGLRIEGEFLCLDPCIPKSWPGFEMTLRHRSDCYEIVVENPDGVSGGIASAKYDGKSVAKRPLRLALKRDGQTHHVRVRLG